MSLSGITFGAGITLGQGITISSSASGPLTVNWSDIINLDMENGSDDSIAQTITIDNDTETGVAFLLDTGSSLYNNFVNTPDNGGYIWTARWASGSTTITTPVVMFVGYFGAGTVVFFVLDPSDNTYATGQAGTFNFPVTFTAGTLLDPSPTPG
jgi:hypothetical protein